MLSTNEKLALTLVRIRANMMIFRIEKRNQSSQPQSFIRHKNEQSFSRQQKLKGKRLKNISQGAQINEEQDASILKEFRL